MKTRAGVLFAALMSLLPAAHGEESAQQIEFSGPIPVTESSKPFGTAMRTGSIDAALMKRFDYVEEEYFLSGVANVYGPGGKPSNDPDLDPVAFIGQLKPLAVKVKESVPFTTRAVILRPGKPKKFSGNVHVIPFHNVMGTVSVDESLLRNGDAWIGLEVSNGTHFGTEAKLSGGVEHLVTSNPQRYGSLKLPGGEMSDWPGLSKEKMGQAFKTLNFGGTGGGLNIFILEISRGYAQAPDIMTQVAALLRSNVKSSPLAGYKVKRLYTSGGSGQSTILKPYVDFHHDPATDRLGAPPFDGYVIMVGTPPVVRPKKAALVMFQSEGEAVRIGPPNPPNSDDPKFRYYEIPGTGHMFSASREISNTAHEVLPEGVQGLTATGGATAYEPYDKFNYPILWGVWRNLYRWVDDGVPMPIAEPIKRDPKAADGIARDSHGNALGGLRTPWVDVPDARYVASMSKENPLRAGLERFSEARMTELYGSRDAYLKKLEARFEQMAKDKWIAKDDIPAMLASATPPAKAVVSNPGEAPAKSRLSADSTVGEILDDPQGKAILLRLWGDQATHPMIKMAHGKSLRKVSGNPLAGLSAEQLNAIDAALRQLK
jgi:hypothetical protein